MKEYIKLAWRNIWRNRSRTLITMSAIAFAVFLSVMMRSFQLGSYEHMIYNVVSSYSGYIQIHGDGFWEDKIVDNSFEDSNELHQKLTGNKNVVFCLPRLESFALASVGSQTKGVIVNGIMPEKENLMTKLANRVVAGKYLSKNDNGIILGERLAKFLKIAVNDTTFVTKTNTENQSEIDTIVTLRIISDTLVLIGKGYHGANAAGKYPVRGILRLPTPDIDNNMVYLSLESCRELYSCEKNEESQSRLTTIALNLEDHGELETTIDKIRTNIGDKMYDARGFAKFLNELTRKLEFDSTEFIRAKTTSIQKIAEKDVYALPLQTQVNSLIAALQAKDSLATVATIDTIKQSISDDNYDAMTWKEMLTELVQQIESDNASGIIMLGILYAVVGFGIFGTILMMTAERRREFGVMVAVGMQKHKLGIIILYEILIIGILGIITGAIAGTPVVYYFHQNPIQLTGDLASMMEQFGIDAVMPWAWRFDFYFNQAIVIVILTIIATVYPVIAILKLDVIKSLKS